jgi:hypothetical protein
MVATVLPVLSLDLLSRLPALKVPVLERLEAVH